MIEIATINISKYQAEDEESLLQAIKLDSDWDIFTNDKTIDFYKNSLKNSITYVCRHGAEFAGYIRAIHDEGIAVYISELYVVPEWRNQKIGRTLLKQVKKDFPELVVYTLSDEDAYYEKLGYQKIGSVFQL